MKLSYNKTSRDTGDAECLDCDQRWGFIWSSKAPPKAVLFTWRSVHEALPTTVQLRRRGIRLVDGYGCCGATTEDVVNVLFFCSLTRLVRAIFGLPWKSVDCVLASTEGWFREVHRKVGRWDRDLFLTICWTIWRARNQRLF